jgi:hypothetical protein
MAHRFLALIAVCAAGVCVSSQAFAVPVTTDSCLAKGLCAYVNTHGHVTCGRCPGQVIRAPAGAKAVCNDGSFSVLDTIRTSRMCVGKGGVNLLLKQ